MAAVRVAFCWFGVHKTLTLSRKLKPPTRSEPKAEYLSAGKELLDTRLG